MATLGILITHPGPVYALVTGTLLGGLLGLFQVAPGRTSRDFWAIQTFLFSEGSECIHVA